MGGCERRLATTEEGAVEGFPFWKKLGETTQGQGPTLCSLRWGDGAVPTSGVLPAAGAADCTSPCGWGGVLPATHPRGWRNLLPHTRAGGCLCEASGGQGIPGPAMLRPLVAGEGPGLSYFLYGLK